MIKIPYLPGTSQVVLFVFDFRARIFYVFIIFHNRLIEAVASRKPFDPLKRFPFEENKDYPDREVADLVLDCEFSVDLGLRMEILPELLELMPKVDASSIRYTVKGQARNPLEPIRWGDINFMVFYTLLQEKCFPVIENDKYYVRELCDIHARALAESVRKKKTPTREGLPGKKCQVIPFPKAPGQDALVTPEPKPKRHKIPKGLLKLLKTMGVKRSSEVIFKALHKASWYSHSSKLWIWHQKRHKFGRWCTCGLAVLADMTGYHIDTVCDALKELKALGVIFERAHGTKGVSNTIWELAKGMRHVNAEKRNPRRPKK